MNANHKFLAHAPLLIAILYALTLTTAANVAEAQVRTNITANGNEGLKSDFFKQIDTFDVTGFSPTLPKEIMTGIQWQQLVERESRKSLAGIRYRRLGSAETFEDRCRNMRVTACLEVAWEKTKPCAAARLEVLFETMHDPGNDKMEKERLKRHLESDTDPSRRSPWGTSVILLVSARQENLKAEIEHALSECLEQLSRGFFDSR